MQTRYLIVVSETGHGHAWEWNPASGRSIGKTHTAILWAEARKQLTRAEAGNAHDRVDATSTVQLSGIFRFFMGFFGTPQTHDAAIVELTQEVGRG
jgi:hypothetical protein